MTTMDQYINVSSITYAIKGRDLLLSRGMVAYIARTPAGSTHSGCGYSIFVKGERADAERLLREGGIKMMKSVESGR